MTKLIDTMLDFAIIVGISLIIFYGLTYLGAPIWISLGCVAIWGGYTGYKPKIVRKYFKFLYKEDSDK